MIRHISKTLTPSKILVLPVRRVGNGVGGIVPGSLVTFHAGSSTLSLPCIYISTVTTLEMIGSENEHVVS